MSGDKPEETETTLEDVDINRLMQLIPHRYPMLLIDRIVDIVAGERCIGVKNITYNEPQFMGHFPGQPVMPGVLMIEAMAQTAGALVIYSTDKSTDGKLVYFLSVDDCRFRRPVVPGDRLELHVTRVHNRGDVWKFHGVGKVDGKVVCEANYAAMLVDPA